MILSAVSLILSYPNFNFAFLAWVGLVPLLFAVENKDPKKGVHDLMTRSPKEEGFY